MNTKGIIGREDQIHKLNQIIANEEAQLVAIYGRRRVGKTYLVKKYFDETFDFYFCGSYDTKASIQIDLFRKELEKAIGQSLVNIKTWFDAFDALQDHLVSLQKDRIVIFLDEIPWLDTPRSNFLAAFSKFWNMWGSTQQGLKVITCGSATTWMLDKFVGGKGGFYGRSNCSIYLPPFTLYETEQFLSLRNFVWTRQHIIEAYMVLGGIPYYLDMLDPSITLEHNIDELFFAMNGALRNEYDFLFRTLFKEATLYRQIVETIASKRKGLSQAELKEHLKLSDGGKLSEALNNLQKCDFIRMYNEIGKTKRNVMFQLTDLYTLFYLNYVKKGNSQDEHFWTNLDLHSRESWQGYAFEMVCLHHIPQIKKALGIGGVLTNACSWQTKAIVDKDGTSWNGTQIDLLLERADKVINLCEMKYCSEEYVITEAYDRKLRDRISIFRHHTRTRSALPITFITPYGLKRNNYGNHYLPYQVMMEELFIE